MENKETRTPPRRGPGSGPKVAEKPKDFQSSIKRLIKELKSFRILVIISLVLACLGSVLSIMAPDKLSSLTDEISKGLVVNQENLTLISDSIMNSLDEEKLSTKISLILDIKMNQNTINQVMTSEISVEDKNAFMDIINSNDVASNMANIPSSVLNIILNDSTYQEILITKEDKLIFLDGLTKMKSGDTSSQINIPESISNILFTPIEIDDTEITALEQAKFVSIFSTLGTDATPDKIYKKIDQMPNSIKKLVEPKMDMEAIKDIAALLLSFYLCSALFTYIQSISMTDVANKFAKSLRTRISHKINKLPLKYFDTHQTGDILSRITNDIDTIAQSMNQSLATLVSASTLFIGTLLMMFITNWIMAITAILSTLIGFIFMFTILGKSQKYFVERQNQLGNLNGHIEEVYSGLNVVKAYNGKQQVMEKFNELNNKMYHANKMSQFLSGLMMPMMNFIGNFGYVAVCIVGALLTLNGKISFGVIVAFISYVRLFTSPLSQIAQAMTSLQSTAAAGERVFEFIDEEEMASQEHITKELAKSKVKGQIEFKNVMFKYDGNEKPTINNFTSKAMPGQKIAIVGPTGAGKTTMVNLLMKFYEINKGDIKIDGVSTKNLTRENIHDLFTMVLQDTWLFNGTVKENIIYNRKNISDEQVKEVCKIVGLDHFIKTLPQGYNTILNDNDSVSAGQRQLLTIARGMLEDAPFLILDEATSNVDTRTEELVQKAMDKLTEGRTSFIIAHRLSTIKNADLILVMKDGNIIETGNHKELMKKKGFYADLYNSQFQNN